MSIKLVIYKLEGTEEEFVTTQSEFSKLEDKSKEDEIYQFNAVITDQKDAFSEGEQTKYVRCVVGGNTGKLVKVREFNY